MCNDNRHESIENQKLMKNKIVERFLCKKNQTWPLELGFVSVFS